MPEPPQLALFYAKEQWLYSESLSDDRASHPIPKGDAGHPPEKTHFGCSYPRSCSFGHDPPFMTIGEGRNEDWPVDWELCLLAQLSLHHHGAAKRTQNCSCWSNSLGHLTFPCTLTREQDPKILELLHLGKENNFLPGADSPSVSGWEPWPPISRCWSSSQSLHTWLQTNPVSVEGHKPMVPSGLHHLQKAAMQSSAHQTATLLLHDCALKSCPWISQTG